MNIPRRLLARIESVRAKRPRTVLRHILRQGYVTTQELRDIYGYNHPPRAVRDVRELGIPVETFRVLGSDGRRIAAYRIAASEARPGVARSGRHAFPKELKQHLVERDGPRCQICWTLMEPRYLQIDHRVPYEIAGEAISPESRPRKLMLLCSSCNRAKSWSCEHCDNRTTARRAATCRWCYWSEPQRYRHIATLPQRRVQLAWTGGDQVRVYEKLRSAAARRRTALHEFIMEILDRAAESG